MKVNATRGGFYPSIMVGVTRVGPYLLTSAASQAVRLVNNNKTRMAKRRSSRKMKRRRTKRTKRS